MTEIALYSLAIVIVQCGAICRHRAALQPTGGGMASNAKVSGIRCVLVGNGHAGEEKGITHCLGHHAASPVKGWFHCRVVSSVTIVTFVRGFQLAGLARLGSRHKEIIEGRWDSCQNSYYQHHHPANYQYEHSSHALLLCEATSLPCDHGLTWTTGIIKRRATVFPMSLGKSSLILGQEASSES
jgi:hypothetical protein